MLNREKHTKILNAYLSRLNLADLRAIVAADENCWHAQLNLGNSSQIEAQEKFRKVVCSAIDSVIDHDLDLIEKVLKQNV